MSVRLILPSIATCLILAPVGLVAGAREPASGESDATVSTIVVTARRAAIEAPASTFASPVTALRYDPRIDVQSRGLAEGQADISVRGGLFENTGFRIGTLNLVDPQTGHYFAELPVPPAMLAAPELLTGVDNAIGGLNSTVATVAYDLAPVKAGAEATAGLGTDNLRFLSARAAGEPGPGGLAGELTAAASSSDGSRPGGDHEFERYALRLQTDGSGGRTDLILSYQDKFYGWPGAYTGLAALPETDRTKTTLALLNHRRVDGENWWEAGAWYRRLVDDYDFDRRTQESGVPGAFEHETRIGGAALQGRRAVAGVDLRYSAQLAADQLVRSTDLTAGRFASRSYASLALLPTFTRPWGDGEFAWGLGARLDWSNREDGELLPSAFVEYGSPDRDARRRYRLAYAASAQVPGYTALASPPEGLFGGNASLGRETARSVEFSVLHAAPDWRIEATVFHRRDEDLVDWTFVSGAPFARQANAVDLDVLGAEFYVARVFSRLTARLGYAWLDKDADYGSAAVDASYYALNYARHRLTLALEHELHDSLRLAVDAEARRQADNPLRQGSDEAFAASLALYWRPVAVRGITLGLVADNLTNSDFQEFPGTPAPRRQVSLQATFSWQ